VLAVAAVAFVSLVATALFAFPRTRIECSRAKGAAGECVVTTATILGGSSVERIPSATIAKATLGVSTTTRAGASPGHTDARLVIAMKDGSERYVDDVSFAPLDPSFGSSDVEAFDRFVHDEKIERASLASGGVATPLVVVFVLSILIGVLAFVFGKTSIRIVVEEGELVVQGPEENTRHPLAGFAAIDVDKAYRSLRVRYQDGRSVQTAKLGASVAKLEEIAKRARGIIASR
jgi:hypothetical protein